MSRLHGFTTALYFLIGLSFSDAIYCRDRFDSRIAIIGAGAAGLTAALTLSDMGYRDVTIFESGEQVGGKVYSSAIDSRIYEMGAAFILPDYKTVFELADRFKVPYGDSGLHHQVSDDRGHAYDMIDYPQQVFGMDPLIRSMLRFDFYRFFNPVAFKNDFSNAPKNMNINFDQFARRHGINSLALSAAPMMVGCGYGYMNQVPALYLMQLMNSFVPLFQTAMIFPNLLKLPNFVATFPHGYLSLWKEIARHLNVRLKSPVTKVVRSRTEDGFGQIELTAGQLNGTFDRLVISSPLDKALNFLDASETERGLFSRIRYYPYTVTQFRGVNLKKSAITFLAANTNPETIGQMTGLYNQYSDADIWTAGQIGSWSMGPDILAQRLREDVTKIGGEVDEILAQRTWSHFPHVSTEDLDNGFYQRMDQIQGDMGTYYIGGIMNFDSVENTARFARNLMQRKF